MSQHPVPPHPDDVAVNQFATEINAALARARRKGRDGWQDANVITTGGLAQQMAAQFLKRTPSTWVDIAAYAMMLHFRGADPSVLAEAIRAAPFPAGADSGDDSQPDGPVVDGRTVKVGDRVRLRSGDVLPVLEVMRYPDTYYPWQIRHYANRRPELYGSTGRQMHEGVDHHNDIVGFVGAPEEPPSPAPVDLSRLRPGDVVALHGGDIRARDGGRLALVLHVDPPRDGRYWVVSVVASQGSAMRLSSAFTITGAAAVPASDAHPPLSIVQVIKAALPVPQPLRVVTAIAETVGVGGGQVREQPRRARPARTEPEDGAWSDHSGMWI